MFDALDIIDDVIVWKLIFPLVLVAVGISIIASFFRGGTKKTLKQMSIVKVNHISMIQHNIQDILLF